jgi:hypothetical protein
MILIIDKEEIVIDSISTSMGNGQIMGQIHEPKLNIRRKRRAKIKQNENSIWNVLIYKDGTFEVRS